MVEFKLAADSEFVDAMWHFNFPYEIVSGEAFDHVFSRVQTAFRDCFSFNPLFTKPNESLNSFAFRMKARAVISGFYIRYAEAMGTNLCIINDNPTTYQEPNLMFVIPRSTGAALSLDYKGGNDHICFNESLDFLVAADTNRMLVGYGKAGDWVRDYREKFPEFFVTRDP